MPAIRMTVVSAGLMAMLSTPAAQAGPIMEWLCGCSKTMSSSSTYAPVYVPPVVAPAPATNVVPVPQQTYYAPAAAIPAPVTAYRLLPVVPRPTPSYPQYNPYSAAPVTVYRPIVPMVTTTRLIPYTSYRLVSPTVTYYGYGIAPAIAAPAVIAQPACPNYGGAPMVNTVPQPMGNPAESAMESPMLSPSDPTTSNYPTLPPPATTNSPSSTSPQKNFVEKPLNAGTPSDGSSSGTDRDKKSESSHSDKQQAPAGDKKTTGPDLGSPNPQDQSPMKTNSSLGPQQRESQDRTTMLPVRQASREVPAAQPGVRHLSGDLWKPVLD